MDCKLILSEISSVLETYRGRDKVLRTLCYTSRLIGALTPNEILGKKLMYFSRHLSDTRATLRLLDDIPMLKYSLEYGLGKKEESAVLGYISFLGNLVDQCYYPIEKVAWLAEHRLITEVNATKWNTACSICWIISIYLSLFKSVKHAKFLRKHSEESIDKNDIKTLEQLRAKERFELITCVRLCLDLIHAVNTLPKGFVIPFKMESWLISLVGSMSSVLGLYQIFAKRHMY